VPRAGVPEAPAHFDRYALRGKHDVKLAPEIWQRSAMHSVPQAPTEEFTPEGNLRSRVGLAL
jgi:hypothetical protein